MTIVLTGGSGYIGTMLSERLLALGDTVIVVDIRPPAFTHQRLYFIQCDISSAELPFNVLEQTDAVINLAGKNISCKWNKKNKEEIKSSRIISTRHVVESMKNAINRPMVLINASGVAYYGERGDEILTEQSSKGNGFLADVVADWEVEAFNAESFGVRVVCIRTAPVIGSRGLISQLRRSARFGFLFKLSKIDFWQPWIHEDDIVNTYLFALQTSTLQGPVNAASPETVPHHKFMKTIAKSIKRKLLGVMPKFISKIFVGEILEEVTKSQKVIPQRLLDKGFIFSKSNFTDAVLDATKRK